MILLGAPAASHRAAEYPATPKPTLDPVSLAQLVAASLTTRRPQEFADSVLGQLRATEATRKHLLSQKARLVRESYLVYLQHQFGATSSSPPSALPTSISIATTNKGTLHDLTVKKPNPTGWATLKALGSHLRNRSDPYIDIASLPDPNEEWPAVPKARGGVLSPFPVRLHQMLADMEKQGNTDIISFQHHGRAFQIQNRERFVDQVMHKYFKQTKWHSFARQLSLYGFTRLEGSESSSRAYFHELFLRGRPSLVAYMRRVGVPQGEDRRKLKRHHAVPDPDFDQLPTCQL